MIGAVAEGMFAQYNWHLFWFAVVLTLIVRFRVLKESRALRAIGVFLLFGCVFLFALFVLTPAGKWAESYTAVNRLSLQIVPAMLVFAALLWREPESSRRIGTRASAHGRNRANRAIIRPSFTPRWTMAAESLSLHELAARCVGSASVAEKLALTADVAARFDAGDTTIDDATDRRGASCRRRQADPRRRGSSRRASCRAAVSRRSEGRAALVHAVAHIEFNAINLAWDAVARFRGLPLEYYRDWVGVAVDEARHFGWLSARLARARPCLRRFRRARRALGHGRSRPPIRASRAWRWCRACSKRAGSM